MKRAKIIVIEGTDGSGKETQSIKLEEKLKEKKLKVKRYSFPVYSSPTGKIVGGPYLGKSDMEESYFEETAALVDPLVSSLYYAADRRYNLLKSIEKEIYLNDVIILDRYTTSNMGHQACKSKNTKEMLRILDFIEKLEFDLCELPRPDAVIFLHMPYEASLLLRKNRKATDGLERSKQHLENAEKTYLYIAKKYKWGYVNCLKADKLKDISDIKSIEEINKEVVDIVIQNLDKKPKKINKMYRFE